MTRPQISCVAPFFIVNDVPVALAFYRDRLGFDVTFEGPEPADVFFGIVERGGVVLRPHAVVTEPVRDRPVGHAPPALAFHPRSLAPAGQQRLLGT